MDFSLAFWHSSFETCTLVQKLEYKVEHFQKRKGKIKEKKKDWVIAICRGAEVLSHIDVIRNVVVMMFS